MRKVLMILGALCVVGIAIVVVTCYVATSKLGPYAEKFLAQCRDGKYEEAYANASKAFRDGTSLEAFRQYMEGRKRILGAFRRIAKTTGGGIATSTSSGTVGSVSAELEYEKGKAAGEFEFLDEGGSWRLLHVKITFDDALQPPPDRAALEPLSRDLLRLYQESAFVTLYQRFSRPLQDAWKSETYEPQIRDLRLKTGQVEEARLRETKKDGEKIRVIFDVAFEKGRGEAAFAWVWVDSTWYLAGFDIHMGG